MKLAVVAVAALASLAAGCGNDSTSGSGSRDDAGADVAPIDADGSGEDDAAPDAPPADGTDDDKPDATDGAGDGAISADVGPDAAPDGSGDAPPDATPEVGPDATPDAAVDTGLPSDCVSSRLSRVTCSTSDPGTCPEGLCLLGLCLGPIVDADRWDACGDGTCDRCEVDEECPADCGPTPRLRAPRAYVNDTTLTIAVHGFNVVGGGEFEEEIYGQARGTSGSGGLIRRFAPHIVDGSSGGAAADAPNQMIGVEYYGAVPADWLSPADIAEIEAHDWRTEQAVHRYALIVAKFIRHYMAEVGATHVNLFCHSMGCHVTRYLIENNIEGVAASGVIARWFTMTGVLGGARLARLFDNTIVREAAGLLNMNTSDFVHMNPDYVTDNSAWWDHKPLEANNPLFAGMLIHHVVGTNPFVSETADIVPLLDLNNPDDEPNDGIVYAWDEFFHDQDPTVQHVTPSGDRVRPTATYQNLDHFETRDSVATGILGAATLYHRRKVWISVRGIHVKNDRERDSLIDFSNVGDAPAELSYRVSVRYNPYVQTTFGVDTAVHGQEPADRSTPLVSVIEGAVVTPGWVVFEGPVFDDMTELALDLEILEMDWFPRFGVREDLSLGILNASEGLARFNGSVPLVDDTIRFESAHAVVEIDVRVRDLY